MLQTTFSLPFVTVGHRGYFISFCFQFAVGSGGFVLDVFHVGNQPVLFCIQIAVPFVRGSSRLPWSGYDLDEPARFPWSFQAFMLHRAMIQPCRSSLKYAKNTVNDNLLNKLRDFTHCNMILDITQGLLILFNPENLRFPNYLRIVSLLSP